MRFGQESERERAPRSGEVPARVIDGDDATVGSGAAAALTGAMAAGLVAKTARLSLGRELEFSDARYQSFAAEATKPAGELQQGASDDMAAYGLAKSTYSLASATGAAGRGPAEREQRLLGAARVPLANARRALGVRSLATELDGRSNPAAANILGVAAVLSDSSLRGCLLTVEANLSALPETVSAAAAKSTLRDEIAALRVAFATLTSGREENKS